MAGVLWAAVMLGSVGCGAPAPRADINSGSAGERILAVRAAGDRKDRSAVPLLVDRLGDEDEAVRFYAILALERILGTRLGYDYRGQEVARAAAVERWRRYVHDGAFARGEPAARYEPPTTSRPTKGDGAQSAAASTP